MRVLALAALLCLGSAQAAVTNDVVPSLTLTEVICIDCVTINHAALEFADKVTFASAIRRLRALKPNSHSWLYYQIKQIETVARVDPARAEEMIAETVEKLRGWGGEL